MRQYFLLSVLLLSGAAFAAPDAFENNDSINSDVKELQEVVVTGTRSALDVRLLPLTVDVISREQIAQSKQINMLPVLSEQIPSLFVTSRGMMGYGVSGGAAGGINVRGLSGGAAQMMVLIDGHPQYQGIFGHGIADSYQTMMIDHVEVLRGPASMLYGSNAMGGVINIVTRQLKHKGVRTNVGLSVGSYATMDAEASCEVNESNLFSSVAVNYGRSNNHRDNMSFQQYGGFFKIGYNFSDHWKGYADVDITHFDAQNPGQVNDPIFEGLQHITRGIAEIAFENNYDWTNGSVSVYDNFGFHSINDGYHEGEAPQANLFGSEDHLAGLSVYQNFRCFKGNRLTVGLDYQHIYGNAFYTSRETGEIVQSSTPKSSAKNHREEVAGYIDFHQDVVEWFSFNAGVRVDWHSVAGLEWIPQAGLVFRPLHNAEIKAMVSKGFRNPTMRELYLYPPSNDSLRAERIWNYELAWKQRFQRIGLHYGINAFYLNGDNMIQTIRIDGKPRNVNTGKVENAGAELELGYQITPNWGINTNHSYLYMRYPVLAAPKYKGFFGVNMTYQKLRGSLGVQYLNGLYTVLGDNPKTQNFWLLNVSLSYLPLPQVEIWVRGDNLLNQEYEINDGFPMPKANFRLGIKLEFNS